MGRKNIIKPYVIFKGEDMSADITQTEGTQVQNLDKASIYVSWTGTGLTGTLTVEAKQDTEKNSTPQSDWFTIDFGDIMTIDADTGNHQILFTQLPFTHIRLKYTASGGTGTMRAVIDAKTEGA